MCTNVSTWLQVEFALIRRLPTRPSKGRRPAVPGPKHSVPTLRAQLQTCSRLIRHETQTVVKPEVRYHLRTTTSGQEKMIMFTHAITRHQKLLHIRVLTANCELEHDKKRAIRGAMTKRQQDNFNPWKSSRAKKKKRREKKKSHICQEIRACA